MGDFNKRVKQTLLLLTIIALIFTIFYALRAFIPGILGAITLYILSRAKYFQLVYSRKWKKGLAAFTYLFYYLLVLGIPVFMIVVLISPRIDAIMDNPEAFINNIKNTIAGLQQKVGYNFVSANSTNSLIERFSNFIPSLINSTTNLLTNLVLMLFLLYYMLINGSEMERYLYKITPLKDENIQLLASETKKMIKANALGIPVISTIQGIIATIGYWIFGVEDYLMWGLLTGIFAFIPIIGTFIIWGPLVAYLYMSGSNWQATGLLVYSAVVTGNVDYLARMTLLRRIGDVHPVLTIVGVIVGLSLFGFIGLIFGPLLLSYITVLFKIYVNEFGFDKEANASKEAERPSDISGES
ncbi:MAG: AI-2E family transporter [Chitinophagaceae bacterium]|nr:AI-2E family transporter [Chitinophagaceae bacterium]